MKSINLMRTLIFSFLTLTPQNRQMMNKNIKNDFKMIKTPTHLLQPHCRLYKTFEIKSLFYIHIDIIISITDITTTSHKNMKMPAVQLIKREFFSIGMIISKNFLTSQPLRVGRRRCEFCYL